jgi:hypothetical protein
MLPYLGEFLHSRHRVQKAERDVAPIIVDF